MRPQTQKQKMHLQKEDVDIYHMPSQSRGIAMLSAVLRSDEAIQVSVNIINTFVKMRRFIAENALMFDKLNSLELKQLEYHYSINKDKLDDY